MSGLAATHVQKGVPDAVLPTGTRRGGITAKGYREKSRRTLVQGVRYTLCVLRQGTIQTGLGNYSGNCAKGVL